MKPRFKNKFCIRKKPALSRRRNFRRKQQRLFLFTQKFLLASLTARPFPMAVAVPYGRKSSRSVCLWFVPLLSPAAPRHLPESPFFVTHYPLVSSSSPPRISQEKKLSYLRKEIARRESRLSVLPSLSNTNKEVRKCCAHRFPIRTRRCENAAQYQKGFRYGQAGRSGYGDHRTYHPYVVQGRQDKMPDRRQQNSGRCAKPDGLYMSHLRS